jgi:PST family polysaccharide transporter
MPLMVLGMNKLLKVMASTGILTLAKMGMGFAIAKVIALYAGPAGMALLGQIQGVVTALTGLTNAPVSNGIIRYTSEHSEKGLHLCSPWWRASLLWVGIIFITLLLISLFASHDIAAYIFGNASYYWVINVIVLLLPIASLGTLFLSIINGLQNYKRFIILNFISVLISSMIMILFIINYKVEGAVIAAAIQTGVIGAIVLALNINQQWVSIKNFIGSVTLDAFKGIGKYVLMATTSALVMPVSLLIVRNVLVQHSGWDGAGLWQAVWKISEVYLGVITIALSTYYLPKLSQIKEVDDILQEVTKTVRVIVPVVSLIALSVYLSRDILISILFTNEFRAARDLFAVQLFGDVIKIVAWLYAFPMLSRCAVKWYLGTEMFFGFIFIFTSYLLIPIYGISGANYAYLISYSLYGALIIFNIRKFSA